MHACNFWDYGLPGTFLIGCKCPFHFHCRRAYRRRTNKASKLADLCWKCDLKVCYIEKRRMSDLHMSLSGRYVPAPACGYYLRSLQPGTKFFARRNTRSNHCFNRRLGALSTRADSAPHGRKGSGSVNAEKPPFQGLRNWWKNLIGNEGTDVT